MIIETKENSLLISIITPSYMQGEFIEDCILSVRNQTYNNIEHIILDSNSTDKTDEIINKYLNSYNVIFIKEKDNGQANAINKGLNLAKGDIVCWLNADDLFFEKNVLRKIINLFDSNSNIEVVTGDGYFVDKNKKCLTPIIIAKPKYITFKYLKCSDRILQPSTFWKRNEIRLDENLHYTFDWKFFIDFYKKNFSILYSRDYYSCYRVHGNNKTFLDSSERKKEIYILLKYNNAPIISRLWAYFVYCCYLFSEKTGFKTIKMLVSIVNKVLDKITDGIIFSG